MEGVHRRCGVFSDVPLPRGLPVENRGLMVGEEELIFPIVAHPSPWHCGFPLLSCHLVLRGCQLLGMDV